nr:immunoglobulin light chain junction region [Macaca mulatta]MOV99863.1 immunoglobulin light chain junction region [Macaca mulatta]
DYYCVMWHSSASALI